MRRKPQEIVVWAYYLEMEINSMNSLLKQMFLLMKRMVVGMNVAVDTQAMLKSENMYFSEKKFKL